MLALSSNVEDAAYCSCLWGKVEYFQEKVPSVLPVVIANSLQEHWLFEALSTLGTGQLHRQHPESVSVLKLAENGICK